MDFDKKTLEKMSVHQLRILGRERGVKSPTSLTKRKLINTIIAIDRGEIEPYQRKNLGRPVLDEQVLFENPQVIKVEQLKKIKKLINKCIDGIIKTLQE